MDVKHIDRLMSINYVGAAYSTRAAVPHLKASGGGRIVYVSSVLGLMGFPGYAAYCASKVPLHFPSRSLGILNDYEILLLIFIDVTMGIGGSSWIGFEPQR